MTPEEALSQALDLLARLPQAPDMGALQQWIDEALAHSKKIHKHTDSWIQSEEITRDNREGAQLLLESLQRQMAFNDISTFGMPFIGFETMEEVEGFMKTLKEIARKSETTHWFQREKGRGRKRLPVQAIILHHHAKRMIEACGGVPSCTPEANVSELGSYLCTIAHVAMPSDESSKAARLACNDWERRAYHLIPDYPLDTPLPKFEVNINKEVMKK